jgi:HTH-type transcriptional regulator/antitoxin MqsA
MKSNKPQICPACDNGELSPFFVDESFAYKGIHVELSDVEYSRCSNCGIELTTPFQSKSVDNRLRDEYRKFRGFLSGAEIKRIRRKLGINQIEAALQLGGGLNAFSKYERGEVIQSLAMDNLLRALDSHPELFHSIRRKRKTHPRELPARNVEDYQLDIHHGDVANAKKGVMKRKRAFGVSDEENSWLDKEAC